ncbi:hypothetical protein [Aurantimonas sp. 22II-16-19i]|uniref:hypothetical protein n=1 Tax=Aurantimonas sp. 22II-16-19i TaxID=1317114 RepID=UPI0009F7A594|nr:hypothetical protein [Aurantimonas sp. 22II-16-19i]ORE99149.1 hypothetical protein ATO4_02245 [Aurantimonas sp. 22II-16-19i]
MPHDPTDSRHARLRAIEDQIEQARDAVAMAQGSMTDPVIADEVEVLQAERQRLLDEIRTADDDDRR